VVATVVKSSPNTPSLGKMRAAQRTEPSPGPPVPPVQAPPELPEKTTTNSRAPLLVAGLGGLLLLGAGGLYAVTAHGKPPPDELQPVASNLKPPDPAVKPVEPPHDTPRGPEEKLTGLGAAEPADPDVPALITPADPDSSRRDLAKAKEALKDGDKAKSKQLLYRAWAENPKSAEVAMKLGLIYRRVDDQRSLYWFKQYQDLSHDASIEKTIEEIKKDLR
jgi:hypothetical protein